MASLFGGQNVRRGTIPGARERRTYKPVAIASRKPELGVETYVMGLAHSRQAAAVLHLLTVDHSMLGAARSVRLAAGRPEVDGFSWKLELAHLPQGVDEIVELRQESVLAFLAGVGAVGDGVKNLKAALGHQPEDNIEAMLGRFFVQEFPGTGLEHDRSNQIEVWRARRNLLVERPENWLNQLGWFLREAAMPVVKDVVKRTTWMEHPLNYGDLLALQRVWVAPDTLAHIQQTGSPVKIMGVRLYQGPEIRRWLAVERSQFSHNGYPAKVAKLGRDDSHLHIDKLVASSDDVTIFLPAGSGSVSFPLGNVTAVLITRAKEPHIYAKVPIRLG